MKRAHLRRPSLARLALTLAPLLAFAAPAAAQSPASPAPQVQAPYSRIDPWTGITVIVTPQPVESPYDAAHRDDADATQLEAMPSIEEAATAETEQPETEELVGHVVPSLDLEHDAPRPSIWNSLGFGTPVLPATEKPAPNTLLPARKAVTASKSQSLPTQLQILEGPASVAVSTTASTSAPVSSALAKSAGGGSGEVKGRVGYAVDNLTIYGTGGLGAAENTGAVSVYDNVAVGSTYKVPLGIVNGDSLGASVEVNNTATVTTGVELRAPLGDYQRFISVQRAASPDADASGVVKAGVLGKF